MPQFTQDNTEGFSDAELGEMNFKFDLVMAVEDVDDPLYDQMAQSAAEAILASYGSA